MDRISDVGVLDKAMAVIAAVERQPIALAGLVSATGLARPTVYRLAVALEAHGLLRRDEEGRAQRHEKDAPPPPRGRIR